MLKKGIEDDTKHGKIYYVHALMVNFIKISTLPKAIYKIQNTHEILLRSRKHDAKIYMNIQNSQNS